MLAIANKSDCTFKIENDINQANVEELINEFEKYFEKNQDNKSIVIDISDVLMINSIGITFLIGLYKTVSKDGFSILLTGCNSSMLEFLKIIKLDDVFDFV